MNLLKVQNDLRSVPDDALIGYVQNPQPHVPSYLALSELQRRQDMRSKFEQGSQQPETSVAEEVIQKEQAPQGGLAAMMGGVQQQMPQQPQPVQTPQPTMMAEAPQFQEAPVMMAEGGLASLPMDDDLFPEEFAGGGMVAFDEGGEVPGFAEGTYIPKKFRELTIEEFNSLVPYAKEQYLREYGPPTRSSSAEKAKTQEKGMSVFDKVEQDRVRRMIGIPEIGTPPKVDLPPTAKVEQKPRLDVIPNPPAQEKRRPINVDQPTIAPPVDVPARRTTFEPQPERSIGDYAKELEAYLGPDTSRAEAGERISKMEKEMQRQRDVSPWMALAQAGFATAAGSSPFALQNIGVGAIQGLKSYESATKEYNSQLEKLNSLRNDIGKAERAEKVAIGKFGADSKEAQRERDFRERLQSEKNAVEYDIQQMQEQGALQRTRETIAGQKDIARMNIEAGRWDRASAGEKGGWTNKQLYDLREGLRDQARKAVLTSPQFARLGEKQRLLPQNAALIEQAIEEKLNEMVNKQIQGVAQTRYPTSANVVNPLGNMSYDALLGLTGGTK